MLTIENSFYAFKDSEGKVSVYDPSMMGTLAEAIVNALHIFLSKGDKFKEFEDDVKKNIR